MHNASLRYVRVKMHCWSSVFFFSDLYSTVAILLFFTLVCMYFFTHAWSCVAVVVALGHLSCCQISSMLGYVSYRAAINEQSLVDEVLHGKPHNWKQKPC